MIVISMIIKILLFFQLLFLWHFFLYSRFPDLLFCLFQIERRGGIWKTCTLKCHLEWFLCIQVEMFRCTSYFKIDFSFWLCVLVETLLFYNFYFRALSTIQMEGLLLCVVMVNTLYILPWRGETDHLVRHWSLFGPLMENVLLERVPQRLRFSVKLSRLVC